MKKITAIILLVVLFSGCSVYKSITNVVKLQYKINSVDNFSVLGINVKGKTKLSDFRGTDMLRLTAAFAGGELPLTFQVFVEAKNPSDGVQGLSNSKITIDSFPWRLFINDKEFISGNVDRPVLIPDAGKSAVFPIEIKLDLKKLVRDGNLERVIKFALNIANPGTAQTNFKLKAQPVLGTPLGAVRLPNEITIIEKEFN